MRSSRDDREGRHYREAEADRARRAHLARRRLMEERRARPPLEVIRRAEPDRIVARMRRAISPQELDFVEALLGDPGLDPEAAAASMGLDPEDGLRLLRKHTVAAAVAAAMRARSTRAQLRPDFVLARWRAVVEADPRELSEYWIVPCRHCWGEDHGYQWTEAELQRAVLKHKLDWARRNGDDVEAPPFDIGGGTGYTTNDVPMRGPDYFAFRGQPEDLANSDHSCPECHGEGEPHAVFHDTRTLSPEAALLFQSVEIKNGSIKLNMRDQVEAEKFLAQHSGLLVERKLVLVADAKSLTDKELDDALAGDFTELDAIEHDPSAEGATLLPVDAEAGEEAAG